MTPWTPAVTRFTHSVKMSIKPQRWQSLTAALEHRPRLLPFFYWANNSPVTVCWSLTVINDPVCVCVWVCVLDIYNLVGTNAAWPTFSPLQGLLQDSEPLPPTAADRDDVLPSPLLGRPAGGLWPPAGPPHHRVCWDALCRAWWVDHNIITTIISCTSLTNKPVFFFRCTT